MESTEMISPLSRSASSSATSDLPTAVGPAMSNSGPFMGRLAAGGDSAQGEEQDGARTENSDADQMRLRGPAAVQRGVIATEEFGERAQHGIAHEVGGEDLAIE